MRTTLTTGTLRLNLTLQTKSLVADGAGGSAVTWADTVSFWGSLRVLTGEEKLDSDRNAAHVTHECVARWRPNVVPGQRIRLGTRLFDIHLVDNVLERNRELRFKVEEFVS